MILLRLPFINTQEVDARGLIFALEQLECYLAAQTVTNTLSSILLWQGNKEINKIGSSNHILLPQIVEPTLVKIVKSKGQFLSITPINFLITITTQIC